MGGRPVDMTLVLRRRDRVCPTPWGGGSSFGRSGRYRGQQEPPKASGTQVARRRTKSGNTARLRKADAELKGR